MPADHRHTKHILCVTTKEPVTSDYLARRVTEACAVYGSLRPGESVRAEDTVIEWTVQKDGQFIGVPMERR